MEHDKKFGRGSIPTHISAQNVRHFHYNNRGGGLSVVLVFLYGRMVARWREWGEVVGRFLLAYGVIYGAHMVGRVFSGI